MTKTAYDLWVTEQQWHRDLTLLLDGAYSSRIDCWILVF